jgi:hypothetical protein
MNQYMGEVKAILAGNGGWGDIAWEEHAAIQSVLAAYITI